MNKLYNYRACRDLFVRWKFRIGYFNGFLTTFAAIIIILNTLQEKISIMGFGIHWSTTF